jgi:hypothetical protein
MTGECPYGKKCFFIHDAEVSDADTASTSPEQETTSPAEPIVALSPPSPTTLNIKVETALRRIQKPEQEPEVQAWRSRLPIFREIEQRGLKELRETLLNC